MFIIIVFALSLKPAEFKNHLQQILEFINLIFIFAFGLHSIVVSMSHCGCADPSSNLGVDNFFLNFLTPVGTLLNIKYHLDFTNASY
jgi:hypothetical protein